MSIYQQNQIMPQLLETTFTQENHQKTKETPRIPCHDFPPSSPSCSHSNVIRTSMAGAGDLLAKEPLSHSGAQSVFPLNPWISTPAP